MNSAIFLVIFLIGVQGQQMTIQQTYQLNTTMFAAYNSTNTPASIQCADANTMANSSFPGYQKIWSFNNNLGFNTSRIQFTSGNSSILFTSLWPQDAGAYQCCVAPQGWTAFNCYVTPLQVVAPNNTMNNTGNMTAPPAWNLDLEDGYTMNGVTFNTYFISLWGGNVTNVNCTCNGTLPNFKMNLANFPSFLNHNILITSFNATLHVGTYNCTAMSPIVNNVSQTLQMDFMMIQSTNANFGQVLLDPTAVAPYRNSSSSFGYTLIMILALILSYIF